jgi:hypothetical protein
LARDAENAYLALENPDEEPIDQLRGRSITYHISSDEPFSTTAGNIAGFLFHAGVAAKAQQRNKLEWLCRYITRPAVLGPG